MKRKTKNIIMILVFIILCSGIICTIFYAKNNLKSNEQTSNQSMGEPPSMPGDSSDNEEPPAKPDSNSSANAVEPPSMPGDPSDSEEPPAKPNENNTSNTQDNSENINQNMMPIDMQNISVSSENKKLTLIYYIVFVILNLFASLILVYLFLSAFNKKTFKETFDNIDTIIIYILILIISTTALTFGESYFTNNYLLKETSNNIINNNENSNNSSSNISYSSKKEITSDDDITSGTYSSTTKDENAISVSGNVTSTISNIAVSKTGDSDGGDNTSFYGTNSAIIAKSGAKLTLKNITVTTDATGANGVFSYGGSATTNNSSSDGTTVTISDSKITTTKDNSGGIMTTGGGTMIASNLEINTSGTSSAAIRSDRGGGTVTVDGGKYTTTGQGSPTIYSTANITVKNATLTSSASEGIVIEGKNSVTLENVTLTDTNNKLNGQSTTYKNIFLYQSMSGDAANGNSEFTAKNSKITTNKGDTLYVTNTSSTINLENNTFINNDSTGNFLRVQKDSWGNSGSNGGTVTLNFTNQKATGNIVIDSISTLTFNLTTNSYYEGIINSDNSAKSITLKLDKTSKIKLTGDSYVTSLEDADTSYSNIDFNGYKLYVNEKAIN